MKTSQKKHWEDETAGKSYIEGLDFSCNHWWTKGQIVIKGRNRKQSVDIEVEVDGVKQEVKEYSLKEGEQQTLAFSVDGMKSVRIGGALKNTGVFGASATVDVELEYNSDKEGYKSESVEWADETGGISIIENLCLEAHHHWEKCTVEIRGKKNCVTCATLTLIAGGALKFPLAPEFSINGTDGKIYSFEIGQQVPLVVMGYISNGKVVGAGASVILTGYYRE